MKTPLSNGHSAMGVSIKTIVLAITSAVVIAGYYAGTSHSEIATARQAFATYLFTALVIYGGYRLFLSARGKKEASFSPLSIAGIALGQVFLLTLFFPFGAEISGGSLVLFGKILKYLLLPTAIVFTVSAFGNWLLRRFLSSYETLSDEVRTVASMALGFCTFLFALSILGNFAGYNFWTVFGPLAAMLAVSWREARDAAVALVRKKYVFPILSPGKGNVLVRAFPFLTAEFFFFVLTFLVAVNFINIVRPMPIGWDDLGVYMNNPKIIAENGSLRGLGIMAGQSFTAIGFLFHSAPQAFFLNQVGGILSLIFIILSVRRLLSAETVKRHFIHIPLLAATAFYAMPMIVFQQAKDMKLDPTLFAITVAAIFLLFEGIRRMESYGKDAWKLFAVSGFVAGIAFAVKFTTLMLFLGAAAGIFYAGLWLAGFYGFFALFVGIFTKLRLWDMLNVAYPKDDPAFLTTVSIASFALAGLSMGYAIHKNRKTWIKAVLLPLAAFSAMAFLAFSPWVTKNVVETVTAGKPINISSILWGYIDSPVTNYSEIRTEEDLAAIKKKHADARMDSSGKTTNEDLGRYFGYEDGINNYLKLPFNLTYQKNQPGEYTEISFIFLALLPAVLLFLAYRHPSLALGAGAMIVFEFAYFTGVSKALTDFFSQILLPGGYLAIAFFLLAPLAFFHYALDPKDRRNSLFLLNLAFLGFYGFIFVISAYGIVWYGIAVYFSMLLAIAIGADDISEIPEEGKESALSGAGFAASVVLFATVATYLCNSAIPHGWNNLRNAGFHEFKAGLLSQEEAIFESHPDYLKILAALNLKSVETAVAAVLASISDESTKAILASNGITGKTDVDQLEQVFGQLISTKPGAVSGVPDTKIRAMNVAAKKARSFLYDQVLYPPKDNRNDAPIYRIGTFLTYFITDNRKRYVEDSLVESFDDFVYDENTDVTVERLKKLGIKYFLIDLNAATIDRDPRHDLTRRFENLLKTFRSDKLHLIKTDSLCLESAMEINRGGAKLDEYLTLAGVNSESYTGSGVVYRTQKQDACRRFLADLIKWGEVSASSHAYLLPLARYVKNGMESGRLKTDEDVKKAVTGVVHHGWSALFEIK